MGEEKVMELSRVNQNSVEISKNAKGEASWKIKLYYDDDEMEALKRIKHIDDTLKAQYR